MDCLPVVGSFGETKSKTPADFGLLSWAIFANAPRNLLRHHFDLAGVRVVVEFRSVRRRWQFAHIIRYQFIRSLGKRPSCVLNNWTAWLRYDTSIVLTAYLSARINVPR